MTFVGAIVLAGLVIIGVRRGELSRPALGLGVLIALLTVAQIGLGYSGRGGGMPAALHIPNGVLIATLLAALLTVSCWPSPARVRSGHEPAAARPDRGSRIQLLAIVLVTLLVMVLGVLVVVAPDRMGVPQPIITPAATPSATSGGEDSGLVRRREAEELLDQAGHDPAELAANLRDIRTVNRLAGGVATVLRHLPGLLCHVPRGRPVEILDLATGCGDIPLRLVAWADRQGRPLHLTVTDRSPEILAEARRTLRTCLG